MKSIDFLYNNIDVKGIRRTESNEKNISTPRASHEIIYSS